MTWALQRFGISIALVWVVITIVFLAIRLVPGNPAELLLSQGGVPPDPEAVAALDKQLGLDQPLAVQYAESLGRLMHGNLGNSMQDGTPVAAEIWVRLPRTLELIAAAAVIALVFGVPAGLLAALRRGGLFDLALSGVSAAGLAVPVFVVGTLMVLLLAQTLGWVSAGGYVALSREPLRHFELLLMPASTIALGLFAAVFRMTRTAVLDVSLRDYVRTARAKGVPWPRIVLHHILRNALIPVVTVISLDFAVLIGGAVVTETAFGWQGMGQFLLNGLTGPVSPDTSVVQAWMMVVAAVVIGFNIIADILYAVLDPRIRLA